MCDFKSLMECLKCIVEESNLAKKSERKFATEYAMRFIGTYYSWGGNDPMSGFDCSGFICEILSAMGKIERNADYTANKLKDLFQKTENPSEGCLVLYASKDNPEEAVHVEYCINNILSLGASGGGSKTITKEDAIRDNAFIKIRPFRSRSHIWGFVDPFKENIS